jgi:hypothetical protein
LNRFLPIGRISNDVLKQFADKILAAAYLAELIEHPVTASNTQLASTLVVLA